MNECLIALGGNVNISGSVFSDAMVQLEFQGCTQIRMSPILSTRPVGVDAGCEFLNAAAVLKTNLSAVEVLHALHKIEACFSRVRTRHWGPRTLDLDLVLYGNQVLNSANLVIPHPAMWYRRFVLEPAVDVAGEMMHPILNESVQELFARLNQRPLVLEICNHGKVPPDELAELFGSSDEFVRLEIVDSAAEINADTFARVNVRYGKRLPNAQPYNLNCREIEVVGETKAEVKSTIEHLKLAMLG